MEILLLKSAACLAILMVFYKLFLEKLNIHKFKRFYLLGALLVSAIIPFITFIRYIEPTFDFGDFDVYGANTPPYFPPETVIEEPINYLPIILWSIYGLGVLLFGTKFFLNLFGIISKINKNEKQKHNSFISVLLNDLIVPHTFFSYIFLNKTKFEAKAIPQEVMLHEQTHAIQKHSLDILFIELLQVVFWFNPLLYFIKKDIKLNHEFLADEAVLKQGIDSSSYQETLLQFTSNASEIPLANAINYSLIKKRFTIMKTQTSKKAVWLRSLLLLPLLAGLLFSFSSTKEVEKDVVPAMVFPEETENTQLPTIDDILTKEQKIKFDTSQIMYVIDKDKYYKNATFKFRDKNKNIIAIKNYDELTAAQKKRLPPPPSTPMQRQPSKKQLNDWLDSNKYGVWFDGKRIENSRLKNIPRHKFAHYFESRLEKNAINYGKHYYQVNLYSLTEFVRLYDETKKPLAKGVEILIYENKKALKNALKESVNYVSNTTYTETEDPILIVNGIVCNRCELNLSKKGVQNLILSTNTGEKITSFKIKVPRKPMVSIKGDALNSKAISYLNTANSNALVQLFNIKTVNKHKLSPVLINLVDKNAKNYSKSKEVNNGVTPKELAEYNLIVKKFNSRNGLFIKQKEVDRIKAIYSKMNDGQRIKAESYPDFSSIAPPPPPSKAPLAPTTKEITEYNAWAKKIHSKTTILNDKAKTLPILDEKKLIKYSKIYKRMTPQQKERAEKMPFENLKVANGKKSNIPPPPPPVPLAKDVKDNKTGYININGEAHYYVTQNGKTTYYDRFGYKVDKNGKKLSNTQTDGSKVIPGQKITKVYKDDKVVSEFKKTWSDEPKMNRKPLTEQFKGMEANGTNFFYEGDKISEAKAIKLIEANPKLNVSMHSSNGKGTVHLSKKGITTVNGKLVKK